MKNYEKRKQTKTEVSPKTKLTTTHKRQKLQTCQKTTKTKMTKMAKWQNSKKQK